MNYQLISAIKRSLLFSFFAFSLHAASAQDKPEKFKKQDVPEKVVSSFKTMYAQIDKPEWSRNGSGYQAEFVVNFKKAWAVFDQDGKWLRSEFTIHKDELRGGFPASSIAYLDNNYKGAEIQAAHIQLNPSGKMFIVLIDPDHNKKTINNVNLFFDGNGSYIRQESRK